MEHSRPDYTLYEPWLARQPHDDRHALSYYTDASIGFLTRGCFRHCGFCINKDADKVVPWSPLSEFLDPSRKLIILLDDNILGLGGQCIAQIENVIETCRQNGGHFEFKQGLDIRLMNEKYARLFAQAPYAADFDFAFDDLKDRDEVERGLAVFRRHVPKAGAKGYLLCGYKGRDETDVADTFERLQVLWRHHVLGYVMRYRGPDGERQIPEPLSGIYTQLARWCNQPGMQKTLSFRAFCEKSGGSAVRTIESFELAHPAVARRCFDLVYPGTEPPSTCGVRLPAPPPSDRPLRVLSLFSGMGACEKAMENLGVPFEVVKFCDSDEIASKAYPVIHGVDASKNLVDVKRIDPSALPDFDFLTFSPPCQDTSPIGKHAGTGEGTRTGLMWRVPDIIRAKRPKFLVMENSLTFAGKYRPDLERYVRVLEELGYACKWSVLNAADHGVPQGRRRVFLVGELRFEMPEKRKLTITLRDCLDHPETVKTINRDVAFTIRRGGRLSGLNDKHNWDSYLVNGKEYVLSTPELLRLMAFPEETYHKLKAAGIEDRRIDKLAGNSVVVSVLEDILAKLLPPQLMGRATAACRSAPLVQVVRPPIPRLGNNNDLDVAGREIPVFPLR